MKGIGGNVTAYIQCKTVTRNAIGEQEETWIDVQKVRGWLDLTVASNSTTYNKYNAKIQESTHVFVADYVRLNELIKPENARMVIQGKRYDVTLIDNPMEMNSQLEFYLKYTGGQ